MVWQDIVISLAQIVLTASLIPQIYTGFKKRRGLIMLSTSIPTAIGIYVLSFCYYTLGLYFSSIIGAIMATLWLVIVLQRVLYR
jgi:hypothetical protein